MGDIALRGNSLTKRPGYAKGGHVNTRRENRLEELGRVDDEKAYSSKGKRNLRDEKKRIVRELKADGGYITKKKKYITKKEKPKWITKKEKPKWITKKEKPRFDHDTRKRLGKVFDSLKPKRDIDGIIKSLGGGIKGKPHSSQEGVDASAGRSLKRIFSQRPIPPEEVPSHPKAQRQLRKKGGWIQSVNKSIKKRGTKGVCTGKKFGGPTCRPGTKRYALAKTFKKMAKNRKG